MRYIINSGKKKELVFLSLIFFLSQGFLVIASGRWWDDWCLFEQPYQVLKNFAMQMGRPSVIAIIQFTKLFPEPGYRIITFLMFYFSMIFLYRILKEWLDVSDIGSFWICALYSVIPINDARMVLACFPYSISVFFFMAGMCYVIVNFNKGMLDIKRRVLSYLLFIIAFTMNSALIFYGLVLLMILMKLYKDKSLKRVPQYIDFLILPIAFWIVKNKLFPAYGAYANYNTVTIGGVIAAIKNIIPEDIRIIKAVITNLNTINGNFRTYIWISVILTFAVINRKRIRQLFLDLYFGKNDFQIEKMSSDLVASATKENIVILIMGIISLSAGLFAYIVVRGGSIATTGLAGRDSTLVALGAAMILQAGCSLLFRSGIWRYLLVVMIMSGIVFFNLQYISYQTDYYRQLGFQFQLEKHSELKEAKNIVYRAADPMGMVRFYSLNGNAEMVYGIDDKLIMNGFSDTSMLSGDNTYLVESGNYHMDSYDASYKRLDAIVDYTFNMGYIDTLKLKLLEIFDHQQFEDELHKHTEMDVYLDGSAEYEQILIDNRYENIE